MFTGLIEEVGKVVSTQRRSQHTVLTLRGRTVCSELKVGDSVAVNGVCLTATSVRGDTFTADVSAETMRRSTLHRLTPGRLVNLERALQLNDRLDGHIVQGHVDDIGTIYSMVPEGNSIRCTITTPPHLMKYIIEKGSIAVDGISLTVAGLDGNRFWVSLIPQTLQDTTLHDARPGQSVNLEVDMLAKYVERIIMHREEVPSHDKS